MNDEFKGKSGKVKVMYVRDEDAGQKPNPRTGKGGRPAARQEDNRRSGPRTARNNEEGGRSSAGGRGTPARDARNADRGRSFGRRDDRD
ncbi:tRNA/rRNA methyltransferase YfiF, partial [Serratia bockelmannii]|nr:tRNA/rRNA methyltransferase YfiF [Serratia bockelmannii]